MGDRLEFAIDLTKEILKTVNKRFNIQVGSGKAVAFR